MNSFIFFIYFFIFCLFFILLRSYCTFVNTKLSHMVDECLTVSVISEIAFDDFAEAIENYT